MKPAAHSLPVPFANRSTNRNPAPSLPLPSANCRSSSFFHIDKTSSPAPLFLSHETQLLCLCEISSLLDFLSSSRNLIADLLPPSTSTKPAAQPISSSPTKPSCSASTKYLPSLIFPLRLAISLKNLAVVLFLAVLAVTVVSAQGLGQLSPAPDPSIEKGVAFDRRICESDRDSWVLLLLLPQIVIWVLECDLGHWPSFCTCFNCFVLVSDGLFLFRDWFEQRKVATFDDCYKLRTLGGWVDGKGGAKKIRDFRERVEPFCF